MLTKLARKYGSGLAPIVKIELAAGEIGCSDEIKKIAYELYRKFRMYKFQSYLSDMDAMAILYMATLRTGEVNL